MILAFSPLWILNKHMKDIENQVQINKWTIFFIEICAIIQMDLLQQINNLRMTGLNGNCPRIYIEVVRNERIGIDMQQDLNVLHFAEHGGQKQSRSAR